nr:multiple epidermal growth factor-like domains protein 10 isoform X1 [Crassostrea gigas]
MHIGTLSITWTSLILIVTSGYDDLSANKNAQQYRTGISCPVCVATNAVDGDIKTCTRGESFGTLYPEKSTWWYVDLGGRYNVYNIRIQFKDYGEMYTVRQRGRFAGFSLYVSNTTDRHDGYPCYKDGQELPPLDFNTNCITNGRYVIFYNERLVGTNYPLGYETNSVFTELCGVTVTGCVRLDVYGSNCDKPCSNNCPEPRCNISNGACYNCAPGWMGDFCKSKCLFGYYGSKCVQKCVGHCKENEPCNHINGTCDNGCLDGWIGVNCDKPCLPGKYGSRCLYNCTGNCLNDETCNITTGECHSGCKTGYKGGICDKECSPGTYGQGCLNNCSGHCLNDAACTITTGSCDLGCQAGYIGKLCEKECSPGTYGQGCSNNCSGHCLNDAACSITTGSCDQGCQAGYIGRLCDKASTHTDTFNENCNSSFYIAGLSFLILIIIVLVSVLFFLIR